MPVHRASVSMAVHWTMLELVMRVTWVTRKQSRKDLGCFGAIDDPKKTDEPLAGSALCLSMRIRRLAEDRGQRQPNPSI
jgi:hypothetical protein